MLETLQLWEVTEILLTKSATHYTRHYWYFLINYYVVMDGIDI